MSSFFGLPAPSSSAAGSSLFGTAATTTTSNPTFSFAPPPPTTTPAPSRGFFGGSTTTSAPTPTFSLGTAATTSAPSGGLFGASTGASPSTGATTSAPSSGLLGNQSGAQQPAPGSSMFGGAAPSLGQSVLQQNPPGQSHPRDPAHFNSLLERQKKKARFTAANQNGRLNQLPSLNMDLEDLARRAQEIGRENKATPVNGTDSRAHYLLAGSGVSPGKAYKDLQALERDGATSTDFKPAEPFDPDNEKYIRGLQQRGREAMIKESMERVNREFDAFLEESLSIDFDEQRQRIMEHFGLVSKEEGSNGMSSNGPSSEKGFGKPFGKSKNTFAEPAKGSTRSVFGRSGMERSMIGTPGIGASTTSFFGNDLNGSDTSSPSKFQPDRNLRDKERFFVDKVQYFNEARLQDRVYPVLQEFAQVEEIGGSDSPRQIVDAYYALRQITKENPQAVDVSDPGAVRERQFASMYLDEHLNAPKVVKLKRQILDGSRTYLEKSFFHELESLIDRNPKEAQLGGRPTVANKIRAYIRVRAARKDLAPDGSELQQIGDSGDYCWIIIFYLLRCGFVKEAADYVNNDPAFQSTDKRFVSYLTTYANSPDRRLSRKLQEMINGEYQQRLRNAPEHTVDPYRMACYKVVGRCDINRRNLDAIGQGVEDWIWLQFSLAREVDRIEELVGEIFGLEQICETVREIGQKHFQKGQADASGGYGTYFFMQILAGMFEEAVAYLHSYNPVSAVHFAIALAYYGLLRVSDYAVAGSELLTYSTTQRPLINFVPLLAYYTAPFRTALPVPAVDYLSLICLNSDLTPSSLGSAQTAACHECLRQLCLETREFAKLLGDIRTDGTRVPGAIERKASLIKVTSHDDFLKAVTLQAAAIADERGQTADAVLLYHLCEDYDSVVVILNRALADAVAVDLGEAPMRLQPLKPRQQDENQHQSQSGQQQGQNREPASSLSLTQSTSSPHELAKNMISLYNSNAAYYNLISPQNRKTCGALLQLLTARSHLEAQPTPRYMAALESINELNILPLKAGGEVRVIRAAAEAFGSLPQILARCAGISVLWAIRAIGGEREALARAGGWDAGHGGDKDVMKEQLLRMANDLMIFGGLLKYKLPARVFDMLTRIGGDVGAY